ncbi:MAG: YCF48-related protein, partial [candidate division WOR-3 bacterium]
ERLITATEEKIMDVHFPADVITGYVVGLNGTVLKTTTGGSIWFSQAENVAELTANTHFTAVHFPADDLVGFMTTTLGRVFFTPDGGEVWRPLPIEFFVPPLYSLDIRHDTMAGFCVGAKGTVIHTLDGGNTWEKIDPGTEKDLFSIRFFADGIIGIIGGDEHTLLLSNNGGYTWAPAIIKD